MRRIAVVGSPGAGKTTFARRLSARTGHIHIELDAHFHGPDWTPTPDAELRVSVTQAMRAAAAGWIIDGGYESKLNGLQFRHADAVIWLDPPRPVVLGRVIRRSLSRRIRRTELWGGNRETWRNLFSLDPHRNIVLFSWKNWPERRARYETYLSDGTWDHLEVHRLRRAADVHALLNAVPVLD